jgi:site-specific recombinase XerD
MDSTTQSASPLRQRMLDDMRMRKLEPKTQQAYVRAVRKLTAYLQRSPDTTSAEDLRNFQLHLVDSGVSPITLNATITGLKFFFDITLSRPELMLKMQPVHVPRTLPVVLSREEVSRLIAAAWNLKHQTALSLAYGTGLRASEVISLKVGDIDSQRMTLPGGFHRIRHYGLLANGNRRDCLALARTALQAKVEVPTGEPAVRAPAFVCRHCGQPLLIVEFVPRERASIRAPPS